MTQGRLWISSNNLIWLPRRQVDRANPEQGLLAWTSTTNHRQCWKHPYYWDITSKLIYVHNILTWKISPGDFDYYVFTGAKQVRLHKELPLLFHTDHVFTLCDNWSITAEIIGECTCRCCRKSFLYQQKYAQGWKRYLQGVTFAFCAFLPDDVWTNVNDQGPILLAKIGKIKSCLWHEEVHPSKKWNVVTHPCFNLKQLNSLSLKLGHEWVITSYRQLWMWLRIHVIISVKPC